MTGNGAPQTPPPPADFEALKSQLATHARDLPKRLRQCARFVLDNPDEVALGTTSAIARAAGVQPSTLVRFAQGLGFSGFSEMQVLLKDNLLSRGNAYEARLRRMQRRDLGAPIEIFASFAGSAHAGLTNAVEQVDAAALDRAVDVLARARHVHFLGLRRSFPVAHYLFYAFGKIGKPCSLLDNLGGMLASRVDLIGPDDALFATTFHPYAPETAEFVEAVHQAGRPIVAITDTALSPVLPFATVALLVQDAAVGEFRSLAVTMCLASSLTVAVDQRLAPPTAQKILSDT